MAVPEPESSGFVIAGRISALDLDRRLLQLGSGLLSVADNVRLGGFAIGMSVIASGGRDPDTGREFVLSLREDPPLLPEIVEPE